MNHRITDRHSKNNRSTNDVPISNMNNSFAMLMIYHGVTDSIVKPEAESSVPQSYKMRK
ncbi:hypothetical protein REJ26_002780 [Providencia stuartii]|uniref:Uncharacterized protein n=2 Tax=Providencia TaxID=586 RepID=A0AAI9GJ00_PROST|nr:MULTISPECIES: hypothetical protein [Providencia]MDV5227112.1 hypothetical protein [Providencia rettgeri]ELR5038240.1 hypothetical protein [Providencia stuartii]ELR5082163.1 hypothetical protein [Providencia stuartii]ELR5113815.1 hypothetical protein [Providencia stuartii]ELR5301134.1 hypothetical protein [Providencia stuartii]